MKFIITNEKKIDLKRWIGSSAILQCVVVFVLIMFNFGFSATPLFPKKTIDQNSLIKSVSVKQTSAIIANSQPIKWTTIVKRSEIKNNKNLIQLPKSASKIKTETISKEEAQTILSKKTPSPQDQLSSKDRKKLASLSSKNIFTKISNFLFADLEQAVIDVVEEVVEQFTEEVITTDEAKFVDVSEYEETSIETPSEIGAPSESSSVIPSLTGNPDTTDTGNNLDSPLQGNDAPILETVSPSDSPVIASEEIATPSSDDSARNDGVEDSSLREASQGDEAISPSDQEIIAPISDIGETEEEYVKIDYEIPAPNLKEEKTKRGKIITVSDLNLNLDDLKLKNILASVVIPEFFKVGDEDKIEIKWKNNENTKIEFTAYDLNENGKLDYVEWIVPHLSEQIFEIIFISKAFQLDSDKNIIADIYDQVYTQDNIWTIVENNQYIRVTFEKILDNTKDITIYARPVVVPEEGQTGPTIEVYTENGTEVIANFEPVSQEGVYKIYLTNLQTPTDIFDLKIIGGDIDFDYIVDPAITWDGGGADATCGGGVGDGNKWSCTLNWSTDTLPGAADVATFDATSTKVATITANISVGGIAINSGYTGTITQGSGVTITVGTSHFTQADGTFTGGDSAITINGSFNQSGGAFTSTVGTLIWCTTQSSTSTISGGTFNPNGGKVKFTTYNHTLNVNSSLDLYDVEIAKTNGYYQAIGANDDLVVNGTLTLTDGRLGYPSDSEEIYAKGTISVSSNFDGVGYMGQSYPLSIVINGEIDQSFVVPNGAHLPGITLNNSLTTISFAAGATAYIDGNFNLQAGTFTSTSGTLYWCGNQAGTSTLSGGTFDINNGTINFNTYSHTLDVGGTSLTLNNVGLTKTSNSYTQAISNGTLIVGGTLTLTTGLITGTVYAQGASITQASTFGGGTGLIVINGAGDQTFTGSATATVGALSLIEISKDTGTLYLAGTIRTALNWTYTKGTLDATTNDSTVVFAGTQTITGSHTLDNVTFAGTGLHHTIANSNTLAVAGTLTLTDGYIDQTTIPVGGTVEARGNVTVGSLSDGGTGIITFLVAGDQTITTNGGIMSNVTISKSSGTASVATGTSANLTINGNFTLSGGGFTAPSGTLTVTKNWTSNSGSPTFNANSGIVSLTPAYSVAPTHNSGSIIFNNVIISANGAVVTITGTMDIDGDLSITAGTYNLSALNGGTIAVAGNVSVDAENIDTTALGTATILFDGTDTQTLAGNVAGKLPNVEINKSGTLNLTGTIYVGRNWNWVNGSLNAGTSTLILYPGHNRTGLTYTPGSVSYNDVQFQTSGDRIVCCTVVGTWDVQGDLIMNIRGYNGEAINGGIINVVGDYTVSNTNNTYAGGALGSVAVTLVGTASQVVTYDIDHAVWPTGIFTVNKPSGTATLASAVLFNATGQDVAITSGTLDLAGYALTVNDQFTISANGTLKLQGGETVNKGPTSNSGTVEYNGTGSTLKDWTYHHLTINGSGTSVFGVDESLGGNFLLTAGVVDFNGKAITTTSDFTIGTGGQILTDADAMDGAVITVGGNANLDGEAGDQLNFKWKGAGAGAWTMAVTGNIDMDYVTFTPASTNTALLQIHGATATASNTVTAYSDASGAGHTEINASDGTNTNSGNNTNWNFGAVNSLPVASDVSIDADAASVTLIGGTTKNVVCAGTVTDTNGYADITSVTAKLYRSGVGAGAVDDNANHYTLTGDANCVPSGGSANTETYTCTFPVYFYADPTDAGSAYSAENWVCEMTPTDTVGAGTADTDDIEMATLQSISVSETIDFGTVSAGAESSGNHITTVTNNGNVAVDYKVSGGGLNCSTRGTISVASQEYGLFSFSYGTGVDLSASATDVNADLPKPSSGTPTVADDAYWQVAVPVGSEGTCTGTTTFVVRAAL